MWVNSGLVPHAGTNKIQPTSLNYACHLSSHTISLCHAHTSKVWERNSNCVSVRGQLEKQVELCVGGGRTIKNGKRQENKWNGGRQCLIYHVTLQHQHKQTTMSKPHQQYESQTWSKLWIMTRAGSGNNIGGSKTGNMDWYNHTSVVWLRLLCAVTMGPLTSLAGYLESQCQSLFLSRVNITPNVCHSHFDSKWIAY